MSSQSIILAEPTDMWTSGPVILCHRYVEDPVSCSYRAAPLQHHTMSIYSFSLANLYVSKCLNILTINSQPTLPDAHTCKFLETLYQQYC